MELKPSSNNKFNRLPPSPPSPSFPNPLTYLYLSPVNPTHLPRPSSSSKYPTPVPSTTSISHTSTKSPRTHPMLWIFPFTAPSSPTLDLPTILICYPTIPTTIYNPNKPPYQKTTSAAPATDKPGVCGG